MLKKKLYKKYMVILKIKYYENLKIKVLNNNYLIENYLLFFFPRKDYSGIMFDFFRAFFYFHFH